MRSFQRCNHTKRCNTHPKTTKLSTTTKSYTNITFQQNYLHFEKTYFIHFDQSMRENRPFQKHRVSFLSAISRIVTLKNNVSIRIDNVKILIFRTDFRAGFSTLCNLEAETSNVPRLFSKRFAFKSIS